MTRQCTVFVWNDEGIAIRQMPVSSDSPLAQKVADELRLRLHGTVDYLEDPRWQIAPGYLVVDEMMLDEKGNRSIFDDVDK